MVKIKICGITNLNDAQDAVSFGANAIGFIFAKSPRKVSPAIVKEIVRQIKGNALKIGVFVNESLDNLENTVRDCDLDYIQLHGDETPEYCMAVKSVPIIKTFRLKTKEDLKPMERYEGVFAYLLDTYSQKIYGGTGKTFDWKLAVEAKKLGKPIILSGGLNIHNIKEAIEFVTPYGVDISSSIERKPGKKDTDSMKSIIRLIKGLD